MPVNKKMLTSSCITPKIFNEKQCGKFKYVSPIAWSDQKIRTENGEREREREREKERERERERERKRGREGDENKVYYHIKYPNT